MPDELPAPGRTPLTLPWTAAGSSVPAASSGLPTSRAGLGLYAYEGWRPTWPAAFIEWTDFGLPADTEEATRLIVDAFDRAKSGELVEIGCHAGNGRTGCIIACMVILAGIRRPTPSNGRGSTTAGTRSTRSEQERWVEAFAPMPR